MVEKTGNGNDNKLTGGAGADILSGLGGNDQLFGAGGHDQLIGGSGDDVLAGGSGDDSMVGDGGNDTVVVGSGADDFDGGAGINFLDFSQIKRSVTVDLSLGSVTVYADGLAGNTTTFLHVSGVFGSKRNDQIAGDGLANQLDGLAGNDTVMGGDGNDIVNGGTGDDKLTGGAGFDQFKLSAGNDTIDGGADIDTINFVDATRGVKASLSHGSVSLTTADGKGISTIQHIEDAWGSTLSDALRGNKSGNLLWGNDGDDKLAGGAGSDLLEGGAGKDLLTGGRGSDIFLFSANPTADNADQVTDFNSGQDGLAFKNDIFDVDPAGSELTLGLFAYHHIDAHEFQAGHDHNADNSRVRVLYDSTDGMLYYDSNGSRAGGLSEIAYIGKQLDVSADSIFVY
jgi:Ca2+-binding RTX toxin-like protein